jgi:hypothetical protein
MRSEADSPFRIRRGDLDCRPALVRAGSRTSERQALWVEGDPGREVGDGVVERRDEVKVSGKREKLKADETCASGGRWSAISY